MDVVVLAGGLGTRMREETEYRPKPMVEVGDRPVLWHIMKALSHYGLRDFRVAMGYKAEVIQDFFLNFATRTRDVVVTLGDRPGLSYLDSSPVEDWEVSLLNTGLESTTADRVLEVAARVDLSDPFMVVYGDGLADINIQQLLTVHGNSGRLATVTVVRNRGRFGVVDLDAELAVSRFREKPLMDNYISIGFIVMQKSALDAFRAGESLEEGPLSRLADSNQLQGFVHEGFWEPMDTYREYLHLNELWSRGDPPWKVWSD